MEEVNSNFTQIPNSILFSGNHTQVVIWGIIRHFETMDKGICRCSRTTISELANISESRLSRYLAEMKNSGLIDIKYTSGGKSQYITKCPKSSEIIGGNSANNEKHTPHIKNDSIVKNSNTVKNVDKGYCRNQQGSIAENSKGVLLKIATLNNIERNNIENNNTSAMTCHDIAHTHEEKIPNFFDFDIVNPLFDKTKPEMINLGVLPWLQGVPDKVYHIAKSIDYRMTVSEMYKFSLMLSIGGYYNGRTFHRINNFSLLLLQFKEQQDEITRLSSMIDDLDNIDIYKPNKGHVLKKAKIQYGSFGEIEISRLQPITTNPEMFTNLETCNFIKSL